MQNEPKQLTPDEYRVEVLKKRFSERIAQYEDEMSYLITQIAQLQAQLDEATKDDGADNADVQLDEEGEPTAE